MPTRYEKTEVNKKTSAKKSIYIACGILSLVIAIVIIFWIIIPSPPPPPLPQGYEMRDAGFLAVPNKELIDSGDYKVPVLGQYVATYEELDVEQSENQTEENDLILTLKPKLSALVSFSPKMYFSGESVQYSRNIDLSKLSVKKLDLGKKFGKISLDLMASGKVEFRNLKEVTLKIGDFDFITGLANVYLGKKHRVIFVDRIYITDILDEKNLGFNVLFENDSLSVAEAPKALDFSIKEKFEGMGVILGCDVSTLVSSALSPDDASLTNRTELLARDLESVFGIDAKLAHKFASEPLYCSKSNGRVRVEFAQVLHADTQNQRAFDGTIETKDNKVLLDKGKRTIRYIQFGGNRAYSIQIPVEITDDLTCKPDYDKSMWSAIRWERFLVEEEFNYLRKLDLHKILNRIDKLRNELFKDVIHGSFYTSDFTSFLETAPSKELKNELTRLVGMPSEQWSDGQLLRKNLAVDLLKYLKSNELPPDNELKEYENAHQKTSMEGAVIQWMRGNKLLNLIETNKSSVTEYSNVADFFARSAELYPAGPTKTQLTEKAVAMYVTAATRIAEEAKNLQISFEEAEKKGNPFTMIAIGAQLLEIVDMVKVVEDKGIDLFTKSGLPSREILRWDAQENRLSTPGIPYPWQKTVYKYGKGVEFKVTDHKTGYLRADGGSIQVTARANVDLTEFPYLSWDWIARIFPEHGDVRMVEKDDQAIQVVVAFLSKISGNRIINSLNYIWDSTAPKNTIIRDRNVGFANFQRDISYFVLNSGVEEVNKWKTVRRNLINDFKNVFPGKPAPERVISITVQTNSWHTNATSSGEVSEFRFTKTPLPESYMLH